MSTPKQAVRIGRAPSTSRAELGRIALRLFIERGFEQTTVDDIAVAAHIGRRTLFRYFASKNDLPWGDFEAGLNSMRRYLRSLPPDTALVDALAAAIIEFNRFPAAEMPNHRERMKLLLTVPALVAHSTLRYADWRQVIAEYAALRLGLPETSLQPQTIAWAYLGVCLAAYEQWLMDDDADLLTLLADALTVLSHVFDGQGGQRNREPGLWPRRPAP